MMINLALTSLALCLPSDGLHDAFDKLLRQHVREERVDYLAIRDQHREVLRGYLQRLAEVDPDVLERADRLAFFINLYNATMIEAVVERLSDGYSTSAEDWGVFDEKLVRVAGGSVSLNHLEHEIIRKQFGEPRIHVALVCGARSCPPLLAHAFTGEGLEQMLEGAMQSFVRDPFRNRVGEDRLELSKIFEWYAGDFGGVEELPGYLERYAERDLSGATLSYQEYSWVLNIAQPSGDWVVLNTPASGLRKGSIVRVLGREGGELRVAMPGGEGEGRVRADQTRPYEVPEDA